MSYTSCMFPYHNYSFRLFGRKVWIRTRHHRVPATDANQVNSHDDHSERTKMCTLPETALRDVGFLVTIDRTVMSHRPSSEDVAIVLLADLKRALPILLLLFFFKVGFFLSKMFAKLFSVIFFLPSFRSFFLSFLTSFFLSFVLSFFSFWDCVVW